MANQQKVIDQLIDYIDKAILKNSVSNRHVASVLDFLNEGLKKVKLDSLYNIFLRKDQPDRTNHKLTLADGVQIGPDFVPGILTGLGALIDKYGNAELQSAIIRGFLEVPEMRFSRTKIVIGDKWRAPGGGLIESVDTDAQTVTLKLQEKEIGAIAVGDICMGIFHSVTPEDNAIEDTDDSFGNRTYAGFFTAYFTITEVIGTDRKQFKYQLRPESERWKHSFHPTEAMSFVSYGNFTDEDRQTSVYETRTYTRMLRKQNTWEIAIANIAFQYGEMGNMSVHGMDMTGYSMYLSHIYMTGSINQINPDGSHSKTANDRGAWKSGTLSAYYDRFSWNSSLWLCINEDGTDTEPADGNTSWLKQVEKGEPGVPGSDGHTTYTWIRYANDANGGGISPNPLNKIYIGLAYNKSTALESNDPNDYTWSRFRGEDGIDGLPGTSGADGKANYTWIAYSDYADGRNMYQIPTDTTNYIGIAVNKDTASESNNPADYTWSRFKGANGVGVTPMGHWQSANVPYRTGDLVSFGNAQYLAKRNTVRPPIALLKAGESYLTTNYGYIPLGTFHECGNLEDWEKLVENGTPGAPGVDGTQGIPGCITRKAEWTLGVEWRNDEGLDGGTRYLDIALVRNNSLQTGWQAYKCLRTHISSTGNAPDNSQYWEPFGLNVNAIFTSLIIAKDAHLDFVQGNQINIKKDDGTVTAGMSGSQSGDKTRIWAGASNPDSSPFRVNESGRMVAANADISGRFSAAGGKVLIENDASGRLANGNIIWDAEGNQTSCGKFTTKLNGKRIEIDPGTNSFRMYNENGKLVVSMVFENMYDMGISMPAINMYDYNASNQLLNSAKYSSRSITMVDELTPGKRRQLSLSPSEGLSFYENGTRTKYYPRV